MTTKSAMPMALYIHWPFCKSKCPYCDFNSHVRESVDHEAWREALLSELRYFAGRVEGHSLQSIFFGGGTPSLMQPATVQALIDEAVKLFPIIDNMEITLEANPTSVEAGRFREFRSAGINRVSLGVQALHDEALKFLGREHSAKEALQAVTLAGDIFPRHNFDLIYARPGQTVAGWQQELEAALPYANGHLSLYQLTIEEGTAFHHLHHKGGFVLPDEEIAAEMYELTQSMMKAHAMPAYEISNHARVGEESRHNLAYWKGHSYLGVGPGAHGRLPSSKGRNATVTLKSPERWLSAVQRDGHGLESEIALTPTELIEERVMMGLRLACGIDLAAFENQTGKSLHEAVNISALDMLKANALLEETSPEDEEIYLRATPKGKLLLTRITAALLG